MAMGHANISFLVSVSGWFCLTSLLPPGHSPSPRHLVLATVDSLRHHVSSNCWPNMTIVSPMQNESTRQAYAYVREFLIG
jgi:hypothetical protein